jgi:hypothetical protein
LGRVRRTGEHTAAGRKADEGASRTHDPVLEELALYVIFGQADLLADTEPDVFEGDMNDWHEWLAGILGDLDIEFLLYTSGMALTPDVAYHFDHWNKRQFYVDEGGKPSAE